MKLSVGHPPLSPIGGPSAEGTPRRAGQGRLRIRLVVAIGLAQRHLRVERLQARPKGRKLVGFSRVRRASPAAQLAVLDIPLAVVPRAHVHPLPAFLEQLRGALFDLLARETFEQRDR